MLVISCYKNRNWFSEWCGFWGYLSFLSNSKGIKFWNFCWTLNLRGRYPYAWVHARVEIVILVNQHNFEPCDGQCLVGFSFETIFPLLPSVATLISEDVVIYCVSYDVCEICRRMSTYSIAHAKVRKLIFDIRFPGNWFGFGIILNDFRSYII